MLAQYTKIPEENIAAVIEERKPALAAAISNSTSKPL